MKKRLFALIMAVILLLTMTACSASGAARTLDAAEDRVEEKLDAVEDGVEHAVRKAVTPESAPTAPVSTQSPSTAPAKTPAGAITREEAEQIALDHVGFAPEQVQHLRTEYEIDDGVPQYDVEFLVGNWEYEFEIHAETGKILSFDKDHKYD